MTIEREILDPKLADALREIDAVLEKYQIAGNIMLASSTHAAFRFSLPKWSGVQIEGDRLHVKLQSSDPAHAESSLHLVLSLRDLTARSANLLVGVADAVLRELKAGGAVVLHSPFGGPEPEADQ